MSRGLRTFVALVVVSLALAAAGSATAARAPVAHAAGKCSIGNSRSYGYTYLTFLWVYNTSCATGANVARHHGHVTGWHCVSTRLATSPVQYQERETCTQGRAQVQWTYTQNT
jgi:hypothetical protein